MPLYFAYGSNMHDEGFRARCPHSRALCAAALPDHRFHLMRTSGYASVRPAAGETVHGLLIDLAEVDFPALDAYEDVAAGLYGRDEREVVLARGGAVRAIVYFGGDAYDGGTPPPGYMECVVAAARAAGLPPTYVAGLAAMLPPPGQGGTPARW